MEFPPTTWFIFNAEEFETTRPRAAADLCVEVMAQVRPNGRIMDHWRVSTGGTALLKATMDMATIIPAVAALPKCSIAYEMWPADIGIRWNMTTSPWIDVTNLLAANEVTAVDETGQPVDCATIIENLRALPAKSINTASLRWAVCISEDGQLEVQLQCLPGAANILTAKPLFKRYI